jgi:hypothetical protein
MSRPAKPVISADVIALAQEELRCRQRGDAFQCAIARSHGRDYALVHTVPSSNGRGAIYGVDAAGQIFPTLLLDGLYSIRDEPDTYHVDRENNDAASRRLR